MNFKEKQVNQFIQECEGIRQDYLQRMNAEHKVFEKKKQIFIQKINGVMELSKEAESSNNDILMVTNFAVNF